MDSRLSVLRERISTPVEASEISPTDAVLPVWAGARNCILALLDIGAPSTMTEVPRLFIAVPVLFRMESVCAEERFGLVSAAPGRRVIASLSELV